MEKLLSVTELPDWFTYPPDFLKEVAEGNLDIGPWQFLTGQWLRVRYEGLKKRFPERDLIPFARRLDNDDIACWEGGASDAVRVVHDFAAPGWEKRDEYSSFEEWHAVAKLDAENYD